MSLPQEIDDYIKESIDHTLGLPVSTHTLELKLAISEAEQRRLEAQSLSLHSKLNQHILQTKSAKAEAKLSAQGLKKAIEKNQQLTQQNSRLVDQCNKLKAFVNVGKLAVNRANEAETRVRNLENQVMGLTQDLNFFKDQYGQMGKFHVVSSMEELLVDSVLYDLIGETESRVGKFLLENMGHQSCRRLLHLSKSLSPSTLTALSLAAKIKALHEDNQQLQILLSTAQGEIKLLSDQIGDLLEDETSSSDDEDEEVSGEQQHSVGNGKPPASSSSLKLYIKKRPWDRSNSED